MATETVRSPVARSRVDFHMGEALCHVASTYATILDVILEQVQNAIDANAKIISVVLNRKTRHIAIRDDGDGVSIPIFNQALQTVCLSKKAEGKLGRFGIGLISPLGKCESFTFTSCPRDREAKYTQWSFVTEDIRNEVENPEIPMQPCPDLLFVREKGAGPRNKKSVQWRTEVNIVRFSGDKYISRITTIDELADSIFERFGEAMRRKGVLLNLYFKGEGGEVLDKREGLRPKAFSGRSLGEVEINDKDAGKVTFRVFLAPKTTKGQNGKVLVGEAGNDYRFEFKQFARAAALEKMIEEEVASALLSGIFEGEIVAEKVKLHATRTSFEKDDAFVGFCAAVETWFRKHGEKHLTEAKEARKDVRYQALGLESLREIDLILRDPAFKALRAVIDGFQLGTVGSGHTPRPKEKIIGLQGLSSLSTHSANTPREGGGGEPAERNSTGNDHAKHQPTTVAGPRGQRRLLVKRDSLGLQLSYVAMDGSNKLWELDTREGVLHFNVNHPTWVACDVSDRKLRQLQESVAVFALSLEAVPTELREHMRLGFTDLLNPLVHLYHNSPAFSLRRRM